MADLVTQADIEARYPPNVTRLLWSDNGAGQPGPRMAIAIRVASRMAEAILLKAWSEEQIAELVARDEAVKDAICDLAVAHGAKAKPEWTGQDRPYAGLEKQARETLELLAKAQLRSVGEKTAGSNPNVKGSIGSGVEPQYMFAPSKKRPYPGGY